MIKKLPQVLTDAVVVISAHEQRYWELLCNNYKIILPATIFEDEVFYFYEEDRKQALTPSKWVSEGKVVRLEAEIDDYENLNKKLTKNFLNSLDPGEREALALLGSKNHRIFIYHCRTLGH